MNHTIYNLISKIKRSEHIPSILNGITLSIVAFICYDSLRTPAPLLSANMTDCVIAIGIYLAGLSCLISMNIPVRFHYNCVVVFLFAMPLFNPWNNWGLDRLWPNLLVQGFGIFFVVFLGAFWKPTQYLYGAIGKCIACLHNLPVRVVVAFYVLAFFILTAVLSQVLFSGLPHVADSHAMYMHSKIMAEGKLCDDSHPMPRFFDFQNVINDGRYCSIVFPGHVMLLAIGQWVGFPWLVNPLLGALGVLAVFLLAREISDTATGYIAAALMLVSPFIVFLSSEFMNHASCILFLTLFLYAYIRLRKTGKWEFAALTAFCGGYAVLIRVQSTVPFALPVALHALWMLAKNPKNEWKNTAVMVAVLSGFLAFLLYYNESVTGDMWVTAYQKYDRDNLAGYIERFANPGQWLHLSQDIQRALGQLVLMHSNLFGWPTSSLIFVPLLFLLRWQPSYSGLLISCCISQFLGLIFVYPVAGTVFEPRYIYESAAPYIIFTASFLRQLPPFLQRTLPLYNARIYSGYVAVAMLIMTGCAFPHYINRIYNQYSNNYWEGDVGYYQHIMHTVQSPALVFMSPYERFRQVYFTLPPRDKDPVIFARDLGMPKDKGLMDYYMNRHVYQAQDNTITQIR